MSRKNILFPRVRQHEYLTRADKENSCCTLYLMVSAKEYHDRCFELVLVILLVKKERRKRLYVRIYYLYLLRSHSLSGVSAA